ncbi:hypothetical protein LSTR_LSTR016194 [Laodelphax striatellus]|uniref:Uncharacterized protein n=1 Tax=Laodelphax striatellus TaxID=195883 RepID=A0A482XUQ9_LAOST|nr:hypothetical protein LSTR_LSTR001105 [Laodelphax striatellus]RZF49047.1 hypothetical protein LSTR_LSTR016194 [Laodelphax striatellus]
MDSTTTLDKSFASFITKKPSNLSICHLHTSHSSIPSVVKNRRTERTHGNENNDGFIVSSAAVPLGIPVYVPERIINGLDPLHDLIDQKRKWSNKKNRLIYANLKNPSYDIKIKNDDCASLPIGVVKLADHLRLDPDSKFVGEYNWYHTDGNLKTIAGDNFNLLASSRFSVPGVILLQSIRPDENNKKSLRLLGSEICLHTGSTQPILQISSHNNIVVSRQKNTACLFSIESDDGLIGERCHKYESLTNLTSLSIAPNATLHDYCTLDSSKHLQVWVPSWKNVTKTEGLIEEFSSNDSWGNVKYISENTILLANRDLVCLKDLRYKLSKNNGQSWKKNQVNSCEDICNTVLSKRPDSDCYVATTHQLLKLDFRKSYIKSWTHMMDSPPSLGFSTQSKDGDEIVALGSQSPGEVCCVLTGGNNIPYHLPSPSDTLHKCRSKGICLDPSLSSRCNLSISGLDEYCSEDSIFFIRQTSVGDIFYQKIDTNRDSCGEELEIEDLRSWEKQCAQIYENVSSSVLAVSNESDCGTLVNTILNKRLHNEVPIKGKLPKRLPWKMSKEKMMKLKNPFLECLLDVWEIEDEPEWGDSHKGELETAASSPEQSGSKVSGWLNDMLEFNEDTTDSFQL